MAHVRRGDLVVVTKGKDKGKRGKVLRVIGDRVIVEKVMMVKRHTRPNPQRQIKGGIAEKESPIHASNVMVLTSDAKPTRVGYKVDTVGGKTRRTRVAKKTGETLDKKG